MYENNNVTPQAPQKQGSGSRLWLVFICLGIVLFIVGCVIFKIFGSKDLKRIDYTESFSASDISRLNINIEWTDLTIGKSEDDMIYVDAENVPAGFTAKQDSGTFMVRSEHKKHFVHIPDFLDDDNDERSTIKILIPEKEYSSFILDLGAGATDVSGISCGDFIIDCGAGKVTFSDIRCNSGDIDCGAGEMEINDINCEGLLDIYGGAGQITVSGVLGGIDIVQGVGEFSFNGTVNGNINADGGVGEITFRLTNPPEDFYADGGKYKLKIDTGIGSANVYYNQG